MTLLLSALAVALLATGGLAWRARRLAAQVREMRGSLAKCEATLEDCIFEQVDEAQRLIQLRRFLSPAAAEAVLASGSEDGLLRPRRREVAAFCCDLRSFTAFAASSSPEDVHCVLDEFFGVLGRSLASHSATVSSFTGDGLIAFFNDPLPCTDPVLRALTMATELQEAMRGLLSRWRPRGYDLGLGIGIALGFADIGMIGFEGRREYCAVGPAVNLASHLCDEARPGEILIDERAHAAVQRLVRVEDSALISLKGLREPVLAISARLVAEADGVIAS